MRPLTAFPSTPPNLQILEEVLYDLPPLEGAFLHWHTYGVTVTTAGICSLFARRKQLLGPTALLGASIQLLFECATESLSRQEACSPWDSRPLHARLLRHGPGLSAAGIQALLPPGVLVHKTVLMTEGATSFLCTGIGPQRVTRQQLRAIAAALALPGRTARQCSINHVISKPIEMFGMQAAMDAPFVSPTHHAGVSALVLLPLLLEAQAGEVAISLSLWESLVLPLRCLPHLIRSYAKRAYPMARLIELECEDTLYAHAEQHIS